jgi:hypothetical protein
MGKKRIAQTLARAGLHLGVTTVRRMLKEKGDSGGPASEAAREKEERPPSRPVKAKYPNHVWHCPACRIIPRQRSRAAGDAAGRGFDAA